MGKPSAPKAPDPKETAAAQTGTNVSTALANTFLGNVNQVTPDGSLTYSYGGLTPTANTAANPLGGMAPPPVPQAAPNYAANQAQFIADREGGQSSMPPPPVQQQMPAAQSGAGGGAAQNSGGGFTITDPTTGATYNIPQITATTTLSEMQQRIKDQNDAASLGLATLGNQQVGRLGETLSGNLNYDGIAQGGSAANLKPSQYQQFGAGPQLQTQLQGAGQGLAYGAAGAGQGLSYGAGGAGAGLQRSVSGAGQGLQYGVAGAGQGIQAGLGIDPRLGIQGSVASGGTRQMGIDMSGVPGFSGQIAGAGAITRDYGPEDGFSEDRARVEEALLSRINPDLQNEQDRLRTQLVNQGIGLGSSAYDRGMDQYSRQANDARFGAVLAGGQEQSRMMGLERDRAMFQNSAQQQQWGQNYAQTQMDQQAALYNFNRALTEGQFANQAVDSQFGENLARGQFQNNAQGQGFGQTLAAGNFVNAAQQQGFGQNAFNVTTNNAAQGQGFDQRAFNANLNNNAQQQGFGQRFSNAGMNNAAQAQGFNQRFSNAGMNNAAQQQGFGQMFDAANFGNTANQQMYQNQFGATAANNQLQDSQFAQQQALFNAQNIERDRGVNERTNLRNAPINEIAALLGGAGVSNPQFINTQSAQIPTVDYAGLVQNNYANQMAQYNQQQGMFGNAFGNLIGAGGAIGAAAISDARLKADIQLVGEQDGVRWYRFRYLWDRPGVQRLGVMAQEVAGIPGAVIRMANGFLAVDYSRIPEYRGAQ